jgi:cation diffusion facilitator family transporter
MESHRHTNEHKTLWVVVLTAITMMVEILVGLSSHSMALLADGIHMGSHVLAIGLSWIAYVVARKIESSSKNSANTGKILSLSGFSSGLILLFFAFFIAYESVNRLIEPMPIRFNEAIPIAIIGLIVNILSAFILHHKEEHADSNIKAAYLHVIADAITSVAAIIGLTAAMLWKIYWLDALFAIIGSVVIARWAWGLLKETAKTLTDFNKT